MRLHPHEFIRRFLMHVLAKGFHRVRHYGLFANANRAENNATARALLHIVPPADPQKQPDITLDALRVLPCPCPCCGARMIVIEVFARGCQPRWRPMPSGRHVMTQAYSKRRDFPVSMRWLYAGSDLSLDPITAINAPSAR
jgi:hypothetical protein